MAQTLDCLETSPKTRWQVSRTIRTVLWAVNHEHTLALQAAAKAVSPRRSLAEVRAMYLPTTSADKSKRSFNEELI
jgi:hypothetical protein